MDSDWGVQIIIEGQIIGVGQSSVSAREIIMTTVNPTDGVSARSPSSPDQRSVQRVSVAGAGCFSCVLREYMMLYGSKASLHSFLSCSKVV
jgi:hypothetical protein